MGRYLGSSCKYCRREGMKLMLKGSRCETGKCAVERRERQMAPGMHGWRRGRHSDYGVRLREKHRKSRDIMVFLRNSLCIISARLEVKKAILEKCCSSFWRGALTILCIS